MARCGRRRTPRRRRHAVQHLAAHRRVVRRRADRQTHRHGPVAALHLTAIMLTLFASVPCPDPEHGPRRPIRPHRRRAGLTRHRLARYQAKQRSRRRAGWRRRSYGRPLRTQGADSARFGAASDRDQAFAPRSVRASPLPGGAQERGACQADDAQWTVEGGLRCREFPVDGLGDRRVGRPVGQAAP